MQLAQSAVLSLSKIQFKSNSQRASTWSIHTSSCAQSIKDTIQKQFTTAIIQGAYQYLLCSVYQRYNSKAIHNSWLYLSLRPTAVLSLSKIQFKSNSQQLCITFQIFYCCAQSIKDTIQKQFTTWFRLVVTSLWLCSVYQRYNSKAIHNEMSA